jgi:glutathione synthase
LSKPFLYIVDPLKTLNPKTDTTLAIVQEAHSRGIKNFACELSDIFVKDGQVHFVAAPIELLPGYQNPPDYLCAKAICNADDFAAIFMRKDPPVDEAFTAALFMLRCHDPSKVVFINNPDGILLANEKLFGQKIASQFFPPTVVSCDKSVLLDFINQHERVVLKPLFRSGGSGVLVFDRGDRNLLSALGLLTNDFVMPIKAQSYIKEARLGDKRVIILGGQAVGAIVRIPSANDHRANGHAGGSPTKGIIDSRDLEIVDVLKPHLVKLGLHLVGIDIIGGYLTEINVTSPTCVIQIEQLSQKASEKPLRAQIVDYIQRIA